MSFLKKLFQGKVQHNEQKLPNKELEKPAVLPPEKRVSVSPTSSSPTDDSLVAKILLILNNPGLDFYKKLEGLASLGGAARRPLAQLLENQPTDPTPEAFEKIMCIACALHKLGDKRGISTMLHAGQPFRPWFAGKFLESALNLGDPSLRKDLEQTLVEPDTSAALHALMMLAYDNTPSYRQHFPRLAKKLASSQADLNPALVELIEAPESYNVHKTPRAWVPVAALALYYRDQVQGLACLTRMGDKVNEFPWSEIDLADPAVVQLFARAWEGHPPTATTLTRLLAAAGYPEIDRMLEYEIIENKNTGVIHLLDQAGSSRSAEIASHGLQKYCKDVGMSRMLAEFCIQTASQECIDGLCVNLIQRVSDCMQPYNLWETAVVNDAWKVLEALQSIVEKNSGYYSPHLVETLTRALVLPNLHARRQIEKLLVSQGAQAIPLMQSLAASPDETWIKHGNEPAWKNEYYYRAGNGSNWIQFATPDRAVEEIIAQIQKGSGG